jgi:hypothetical protein
MTAAIFGLVGVMVGGALNAIVAAAAERRREARERRTTSRLLGRELNGALYGVREWIRVGSVGHPLREDVLRFPAWKLYHTVAARTLEPDDWDSVSDAYSLLYTVRTRQDFVGALQEPGRTYLLTTEAAIEHAIESLRHTADARIGRPGSELAARRGFRELRDNLSVSAEKREGA